MEALVELLMVKITHQTTKGGSPDAVDCLVSKISNLLAMEGLDVDCVWKHIRCSAIWQRLLPFDGEELSDALAYASHLKNDIYDQAKDFARRMKELSFVFGVELSEEEMSLEHMKYIFLVLHDDQIPQLKYALNVAFNKFFDEVPPEFHPRYLGLRLFPRRIRVRIQIMCSKRGRRAYSNQVLMNTLFQGYKKGLLPASPLIVQKSLDKHRLCLTKNGEISDELYEGIQYKTRELLRGFTLPTQDTLNQSSSSTIQSNYASGGNIGFVQRELYGSNIIRTPSFIGYVRPARAGVLKGKNVDPTMVYPVYSYNPVFLGDVLDIHSDRLKAANFLLKNNETNPEAMCLQVAPACILEPMKVRMITKPDVMLHSEMHKYQRGLWYFLFNHATRAFRLIGETLTPNHLYPMFSNWETGDIIVSGDYSAATDNLKSEVSEAIINTIFEQLQGGSLSEIERVNVLNSLTHMQVLQTKAVLPKYNNVMFEKFQYQLEDFTQTNGQLMGHVLSFVILCIANYCSFWTSCERYVGRKLGLNELPYCLINGDDISFRSNRDHYKVWLNCITEFGFDPSVGKNFANDKFVQINSTLFRIDTKTVFDGDHWVRTDFKNLVLIPFVNFGLITNRRKMDSTKDLVVQRISSSFGDVNPDTLLGRLKNMVSIYRELLDDLRHVPEIRKLAETLFFEHSLPVLRNFGLSSVRHHFFSEGFHDDFSKVISVNRASFMDERTILSDLSVRLDRGSLELDIQARKTLLRVLSGNPFFNWDWQGLGYADENIIDVDLVAA